MKKSRATLPFRFIRGLYRLLTNGAFVVAALLFLAFNAATLTLPSVNAGISNLFFSATGVETLAQKNHKATLAAQADIARLRGQTERLDADNRLLGADNAALLDENARITGLVSDTVAQISARTKALDAVRLATLDGRSVPLWGISLGQAQAVYDHQAACTTLGDLDAFAAAVGKTDPPAARAPLCDQPVPPADAIWQRVKSDPKGVWETARATLVALPGGPADFPQPQFQSWWGATLATMARWY